MLSFSFFSGSFNMHNIHRILSVILINKRTSWGLDLFSTHYSIKLFYLLAFFTLECGYHVGLNCNFCNILFKLIIMKDTNLI
jgi:hypothetical protein